MRRFSPIPIRPSAFYFALTVLLLVQNIASGQTSITMQPRPGGSYLGVVLTDVDADHARILKIAEATGAQVVGVEANSAAEQAGLRIGDAILLYNGETVLGAQQLGRLVAETPQGRKVSLRIWRDGKPKDVSVTTTALPSPFYLANANASAFITDVPAPLMVWKNMVLGLDYEPLSAQLAQFFGVKQGSLIRGVEPTSLAEKAGLRAGDVLTGVAGHAIHTPRDLGAAIRLEQKAMKPLPLDVTREHKPMTIVVTLAPEN